MKLNTQLYNPTGKKSVYVTDDQRMELHQSFFTTKDFYHLRKNNHQLYWLLVCLTGIKLPGKTKKYKYSLANIRLIALFFAVQNESRLQLLSATFTKTPGLALLLIVLYATDQKLHCGKRYMQKYYL